jgi:hypothetical protein
MSAVELSNCTIYHVEGDERGDKSLCQEVTGSSSPISVYLLGCARNQPPTSDAVHEIRHTTGSRLAVGCDRYGG